MALAVISSGMGLVAGQGVALAEEGSWTSTAPLNVPRFQMTSTLLFGGKVLVAGGRNGSQTAILSSAELYDPVAETWTLTGSMNVPRWDHTATLLPNGKVLVAGGFGSPYGPGANAQPVLDSAELYDPATGTWTLTGSLNVRRALHTATLLPNGKVLVAGGRTCTDPPPVACNSNFRTETAELYDPATGKWTLTGSMSINRHTTSAVLLPNGTVLEPAGFSSAGNERSTDIYDPATGTWSRTGDLVVGRARQGAMLLPDGTVLVAAGFPNLVSAELYDPTTGTWQLVGAVAVPRFNYNFAVLPNGKALIAGGAGSATAPRSAEVFDPATGSWTSAGTMPHEHGSSSSLGYTHEAVVLSADPFSFKFDPRVCGRHCGQVLVVGDNADGGVDLYTPAAVALTTCTTTRTGTVNGDVTAPAGQVTCVTDAQVNGSITVQPGGALVLTSAKVAGGVRTQGASAVRICGSQVAGPVSVTGTFGPVVIGDAGDDGPPGCARNVFADSVTLDANRAAEVGGSQFSGNLTVTFTAGPPVNAENTTTEIEANRIVGALSCFNNAPPPTNDGLPNQVVGARQGQCSAPGF